MGDLRKYGCHNRKPFEKVVRVQDGWFNEVTRRMKSIPFRMSEQCEYDLKKTDERCKECNWI